MNISTETCPPLEDLAAFLEGKLLGEERAHIVAHLADCESCYAVFADAARFQLEEEQVSAAPAAPAEAPAPVVPFPQKKRSSPRASLAAIAALLLIGLAIPIYRSQTEMPIMVSTELLKPELLDRVEPEDRFWDEGDMRGENESAAYSAAEFLVGVHLVDLRLALARNDRESTNALSRIYRHLKAFPFKPPERDFYERSIGDLDSGRVQPKDLLEKAIRAEVSLTEASSPYLSFGKWTEAGRISTLAQDASFFQDRKNRRFLRTLLRSAEEQALEKPVVQALEQVQNLVTQPRSSAFAYNAIAAQLRTILQHFEAQALSGLD